MKIHVYMVCWNEEDMLPFFLKHYEGFADRIVAYDNMSSDRTPELLDAHPLCERRDFDTGGQVRDDLLLKLKNNVWKESRGRADWVIVCDADEFIFHPDLPAYLDSCKRRGVTVPQPSGFNMVSERLPEPGRQIWQQIREGRPDLFFSKKAVFDPEAVAEINYKPGAHLCSPAGRIREEKDPDFKLLHYKYIGGAARLAERRARFTRRLSLVNKIFGWGTQAGASDAASEFDYERSLATPLNLEPVATRAAWRKRLLFMAGVEGLANVTRLAGLALSLDPAKYEVHLACDLNGSSPPAGLPFKVVPLTSVPAAKAHEAASQGKPTFDADTLAKFVWEDVRLIREVSPDVVVGDMRQSLSISTRLVCTTYVNIVNAQWSPFARIPFELPDNPFASFLPKPLAHLAAAAAAPFGFAAHVAPLNLVRLKYGLPPVGWDARQAYSYGDYTLYPDVPELIPTSPLPATHRYIGPVLWSPDTARPEWWDELPADKPLVYVDLGSHGRERLLPVVLSALGQLPVTVMAASAVRPACAPGNVYFADHLPEREAAARSRLVICNGGNMSAQQALASSSPVLSLTTNLDQLMFARAVAAAGAGEALREQEVGAASVKRAVWRMLKWDGYREAARRVAQAYERTQAASLFPQFIENIVASE